LFPFAPARPAAAAKAALAEVACSAMAHKRVLFVLCAKLLFLTYLEFVFWY
jgi:hypothetical protein